MVYLELKTTRVFFGLFPLDDSTNFSLGNGQKHRKHPSILNLICFGFQVGEYSMDPVKLLLFFFQPKKGLLLRASNRKAQENFGWEILGFPCGTFYYILRG